jgi:hypothetical protein
MDVAQKANVDETHKFIIGFLFLIFIVTLGCFVLLAIKEKYNDYDGDNIDDASGYGRLSQMKDEDVKKIYNKKYDTNAKFPDKPQNVLKLHLHSNPDFYQLVDLNSNLLDELRIIFERKFEELSPQNEYHISDVNVLPYSTGPIVIGRTQYNPETYAVLHFEHPAKRTQAKVPFDGSGAGADERILYRVNNLPPRDVNLLKKVL